MTTPVKIPEAIDLVPDAVMPVQYFCGYAKTGEQRLMWAILDDALDQLQKGKLASGTLKGQEMAEEVEDWIAKDDHSWPCSFINICAAIGLDPDYIRQGVLRKFTKFDGYLRRDSNGEVLPRVIQYMSQYRTKPYHFTTWVNKKSQHHAFNTLAQAVAAYTRHYKARKAKGGQYGAD